MSNDVRRFDDSGVFWVFLWAGPFELIIVLALLIELLGPAAAPAGVASLLLVMPVQVYILPTVALTPCICVHILWQSQYLATCIAVSQ